jgi:hypothetical protein
MGRNNNNNNNNNSAVSTDTPTVADLLAADDTDRDALATALVAMSDDDAVAAYVAADRSGRATIRAALTAHVVTLAAALDTDGAARAATLINVLSDAGSAASGSTSTPVDYVALVARRVATLRRAADMLETGTVTPHGVPDGTDLTSVADAVSRLSDADTDDDAASALAAQRVSRAGQRRNVTEWLSQRIADMSGEDTDAGPFTVADTRRGDADAPSNGAVSQCWDNMTDAARIVPNVSAVRDDEGRRAFVYVAD